MGNSFTAEESLHYSMDGRFDGLSTPCRGTGKSLYVINSTLLHNVTDDMKREDQNSISGTLNVLWSMKQ